MRVTFSGTAQYDLIIAGAGPAGCVLADRAARDMAWRCLFVEKRPHIAGNCYDFFHENGLLLHRYGPHCFRTWKTSVVNYLGQFTEWIEGNHRVRSLHKGNLYPLPINLTTLEQFFGSTLTGEKARKFLAQKRIPIDAPANSEEFILSKVGRELYEAFYQGYTLKQWGIHPRDLLPSVCKRLPIRFNRDDRYVDESFQLMPKEGFTRLFERMLDHPLITVRLNADYFTVRKHLRARKASIYTGPVDQYFNFHYGRLEWRSLDFEWIEKEKEFDQPCVAINYPSDYEYTRSIEIKHVTQQKHPLTVLCREYPHSFGDPYYPVPTEANRKKYRLYKDLAERETAGKGVYFCGRLSNL